MTAKSLTTFTEVFFANPGQATNATPSVNNSAAFSLKLDHTVQTLSRKGAPGRGPIEGFLFVPSLDAADACNNATAAYVPANVTRLDDITPLGNRKIGLAPWISVDCTRAFLNASQDAGTDALVFFQPDSNDSQPPPARDPTWSLGDEDDWKSTNKYPVYAIPGPAGVTLMERLSLYGTVNDPDGGFQSDYQLISVIDIESTSQTMPSLWGFILAILGTILVLSVVLLVFYQLVQRRHRQTLQRRMESGDIDPEHLGMHQLRVPPDYLDTMPVYVYGIETNADHDHGSEERPAKDTAHSHAHPTSMGSAETIVANVKADHRDTPPRFSSETIIPRPEAARLKEVEGRAASIYSSRSGSGTYSPPRANDRWQKHRLSRSQTTCAICLDDYVSGESTVRELPCGHIFHPDCIDTALTQSSSLCPLCKKSVLPVERFPAPDILMQMAGN
ncbi:RING-H2 finger protein [Aspergillus brunneoviolaceus CBS 621.78]|uniref:RING-type domain-containing protein n=2 Tax=Aspergillus TaxID=5052 RepID=A0A8G1REX8_9EURO|nr:hypothetical protein BO95DRAFT_132765 [Aspergillus brunneoviolaceus CBS 621.78]XP_040796589.1 uncharacterized protein BO72DRAFT_270792 [Aspergillus fijiensis CBS 313.89]RAH45734.1 hypothetical protein BO95DRAFT_132765 [Aspergillus brunneoviolaceus CBS 621.78]RAK72577.1 hypothetical protein BO72DRAFT_270792 [Aspergillus fijiensis CBS 313.89]